MSSTVISVQSFALPEIAGEGSLVLFLRENLKRHPFSCKSILSKNIMRRLNYVCSRYPI